MLEIKDTDEVIANKNTPSLSIAVCLYKSV